MLVYCYYIYMYIYIRHQKFNVNEAYLSYFFNRIGAGLVLTRYVSARFLLVKYFLFFTCKCDDVEIIGSRFGWQNC